MARDLEADLELIRRTTPGEWILCPELCGPDGQGVYHLETLGLICEVGDPYPRGENYPQENMEFIVAAHNGGWEEAIRRALSAEARVRELEAQAAAMRKVIEDTIPDIIVTVNQTNEEIFSAWINHNIPALKAAIANDAGRDLLERMKQLEDNRNALEERCGMFVYRMVRLRAEWLEAHPHADYWPGLGTGFEWLMARLEQLEYVAETAKSLLEDFTNCAECWTDPCGDNYPVKERITSLREALADLEVGDTGAARD